MTTSAAGAVVVGYDETNVAGRALDWAAHAAVKESRPLVVVHAAGSLGTAGASRIDSAGLDPEPATAEALRYGHMVVDAALAHVAQRYPALAVQPVVALEDPGPELAHLSETARLVVVGSRGHGLSRSIPTGQVGAWLARRAACPVVVVPDYDPLAVRQGVLAGVAADLDALDVLEFAYHQASVRDLPLAVVYATGHRQVGAEERETLERMLSEARSGLTERYPDVWAHAMVLPGRPVRRLLTMADSMNLLVVGRHQPTGLHQSPFGHVHTSVVDRSPCPTAVVPVRVRESA